MGQKGELGSIVSIICVNLRDPAGYVRMGTRAELGAYSCFQGKPGSPGERGPPGKLVSDLCRCHSAEFRVQWFLAVRRLGANLAHRLALLFCSFCVFIAGVYGSLNAKLGNKKCFTCKFNRCWSRFFGSSRQELAVLCPVMYCCCNRSADTCRCAGNYTHLH